MSAERTRLTTSVARLLTATLLLSSSVALAQPSDEDKAAARALATQGADALKGGQFSQAVDFFQRAESIMHAPTHLLLLARAQVGAGKLVAAQETYLKLQREELPASAPAAFRNAQNVSKDELAAIQPKIGSLRLVADGAAQKNAVVKLDDVPVAAALLGVYRPVDPGIHVATVTVGSGAPSRTSIEIREGEKKEIKLVVPDAPVVTGPVGGPDPAEVARQQQEQASRDQSSQGFMTPLRGVGIGLGVAGIALIATGGAFLAKGFSEQKAANSAAQMLCTNNGTVCPNTTQVMVEVTQNDDAAAKNKNIGVGVLVGGIVALGAGATLLVVGKPRPARSAYVPGSWTVAPYLAGSGGGVRGEF